MEQVKWFERDFVFNNAQNILPSILERLRGTPIRLEEKLKSIPPEMLTKKVGATWSIKENAGHLSDLEPLWQGRLEDILSGQGFLRAADLANTRTHQAGHNEIPIDELLNTFRLLRAATILALEKIDEEALYKSSLHPRLKTPMRTNDLFVFVAEHDDHHLARMTQLMKML
jgi:uncharacterized damage-inducible protein DinB